MVPETMVWMENGRRSYVTGLRAHETACLEGCEVSFCEVMGSCLDDVNFTVKECNSGVENTVGRSTWEAERN